MKDSESLRLEMNQRFILIRWVFLLFSIILIGLVWFLVNIWQLEFSQDQFLGVVMLILAGGILLNLVFYFINDDTITQSGKFKLSALSLFQVGGDWLVVSVLVLSINFSPIYLLFLWPIIETVILFSFWASFFLAILTGAFIICLSAVFGDQLDLIEAGFFAIFYITATLIYWGVTFSAKLAYWKNRHDQEKLDTKINTQSILLAEKQKITDHLELNNRVLFAKDLELKLAKQQLENLEQAKSKFISVTTHQLRTPLSAIKWTFSMMLSGQLGMISEEQKKFLEKGFTSTQKMITIVNNLLNLDHVKIENAQPIDLSSFDLEELINDVMKEFSNQLESKKIKLNFEKPDRMIPKIEADPNQIRMVLENLLDNAIKYTPISGEVTIQIKDDRLNSAHGGLEVMVQDTGIGIPEVEQKKIFHKFFRATNAVLNEPDGSGIGLFISRDMIENHHGTMWFESVEGKGTSFHFILPLRQTKDNQVK